MKYFKWFFLLINAFILSCSMHFDEFDKSNYLSLSSLNFENQKGSAQIYEEEHLIKVSFPEADSTEDYDYIVIDSLEMSAFADLYLVETKIKTLPEDSIGWDSLALEVDLA